MNCVEVGRLRAYLDDELSPGERGMVDAHLASCDACRGTLTQVERDAAATRAALEVLAPAPDEVVLPAAALRSFRERRAVKLGWWQRFQEGVEVEMDAFTKRWRVVLASAAAVLVALSLVFTPAGTAVAGWLQVFRAEKFAPVTIDPAATRPASAQLNPTDFGAFEVQTEPKMRKLTNLSEAQVEFAVRQPAYLPDGFEVLELSASTPGEVIFRFDRAKSQAAFAQMGLQVNLPASMDGSTARVYVPGGVQQAWKGAGSNSGLIFLQNPSPTLELPKFLESKATRELFYSLAGLQPEVVSQLEGFVESGNTAPVPVMKGDTATQVEVDGAQGVLVTHKPAVAGKNAPEGSYLVWQKGGVVYVLGGTVSDAELVKIANSLN